MKCRQLHPAHIGWIESILDQEHVDFLWQRIEEGKKDINDAKPRLAGNISTSYHLTDDEDGTFLNQVLLPQVEGYKQMNQGMDPSPIPVNEKREKRKGGLELYLHDMWVNYQYKHEFNPYHFHGGMYSFVIWMKIPTDWKEQQNLPFLDGVNEDNRKASNFEFEYTDMLGTIKHYGYRLDSSMEGRMLLFPARLQHTVYPFYNCDEERISISGNLWYRIDDDLQLRDS